MRTQHFRSFAALTVALPPDDRGGTPPGPFRGSRGDAERGIRSFAALTDGMLHPMLRNVTECDGLRHPDEVPAPKNNDLRESHVTDCDDMRRNVTVSAKTAPAPVGSRFKVQRWGFLTKCDGMLHPMLRNPTKPDETRHLQVTKADGTRHFAKKQAGSETCGEWTVASRRNPTKSNGPPNGIQRNLTESNTLAMSTQRNLTKSNTWTQRNLTKSNGIQRFGKKQARPRIKPLADSRQPTASSPSAAVQLGSVEPPSGFEPETC